MYTSPYLVSRGAEEVRRNLQAEVARDRLAARAAGTRHRSLAEVVRVVTETLRSLRHGIATPQVGQLQQAH
jgi:hypothetical protein